MDSDAHPSRWVDVTALSQDESSPCDGCRLPTRPALIPPRLAQPGSTPEGAWPEAFQPHMQAGLSSLIGALALRVIRSQRNP